MNGLAVSYRANYAEPQSSFFYFYCMSSMISFVYFGSATLFMRLIHKQQRNGTTHFLLKAGRPEWDLIIVMYAGCNRRNTTAKVMVLCSFVHAVQWEQLLKYGRKQNRCTSRLMLEDTFRIGISMSTYFQTYLRVQPRSWCPP